MSDDGDGRDILRRMKGLAAVEPAAGSMARAVAAARRSAMRRRIMRWTLASGVAAAIGLATALGVVSLTQQTATAAELLDQAAAASQRYQGWVHLRFTHGGGPGEIVQHTDTVAGTVVTVVRGPDAGLEVYRYDPAGQKEVIYESKTGEVRIIAASDEKIGSYRREAAGPPPWTVGGVLAKTPVGATVKESRDGELVRYDVTYPPADATTRPSERRPAYPARATVWAEPATHLIRRGEMVMANGDVRRFDVTYGSPAIRDVYDAGVPRGAKVVDLRPPGDAAALLARLRSGYERGFGADYVAVRTETPLGADGKPKGDGGTLTVYAQAGEAFMVRTVRFGDGVSATAPAARKPAGWPMTTVEEALKAVSDEPLWKYMAYDGKVFHSGGPGDLWGKMPRQVANVPDMARGEDTLPAQIWPTTSRTWATWASTKLDVVKDAARPGLVGLQVKREWTRPSDHTKSQDMQVFWIDPAKDDELAEWVDGSVGNEGALTMKTWYEDWTKADNGRWYPSRWRKVIDSRPAGHPEARPVTLESRLQVWTGRTLGAEWFAGPAEKARR